MELNSERLRKNLKKMWECRKEKKRSEKIKEENKKKIEKEVVCEPKENDEWKKNLPGMRITIIIKIIKRKRK